MLSSADESSNESIRRVSGFPISALFYLGGEIIIAILINFSLTIIDLLKRILPKPPRDLTNDSVVVFKKTKTKTKYCLPTIKIILLYLYN